MFADSNVSVQSVLSSISRIKTLLMVVSQELKNRSTQDDEVFKPSNINVSFVSVEIASAINIITESENLDQYEKIQLIEYLKEAREELAKKDPAWRKVVGALVISATLLGGAAVAPQAAENINSALKHILGTSITHQHEQRLQLPRKDEAEKPVKDEPTTYTGLMSFFL